MISDKLQGTEGSVATYLRCGGGVNNQIKKGLLLSLSAKKMFNIGECLAKLQARTRCLVHVACLAITLLKDEESARDSHVLSSFIFPKIHRF